MKAGEVYVAVSEESLSLLSTSSLIERLIGNFLYSRGQIEKPIDQLRQDSIPEVQTKLQYANRSTPYQSRGNHLFATPCVQLESETLPSNESDLPILADLVSELSLQENICFKRNETLKNTESVPDTPLTTRTNGYPAQKRRVLGKLQEVSVPLTPQLTLKENKSRSTNNFLIEIVDQVHSHILTGWHVQQVIILIGSTIMSPRETYVIDISSLRSEIEGSDDDKGRCLRKVMQCLFIDPFLSDLPAPLSPTNCHVVLKVDKATVAENPSSFFVPRLRFYLCKRGSRFTLKITNKEIAEESLETVYMSSPRPFKSVFGSSPEGKRKAAGPASRPRDILDTITS